MPRKAGPEPVRRRLARGSAYSSVYLIASLQRDASASSIRASSREESSETLDGYGYVLVGFACVSPSPIGRGARHLARPAGAGSLTTRRTTDAPIPLPALRDRLRGHADARRQVPQVRELLQPLAEVRGPSGAAPSTAARAGGPRGRAVTCRRTLPHPRGAEAEEEVGREEQALEHEEAQAKIVPNPQGPGPGFSACFPAPGLLQWTTSSGRFPSTRSGRAARSTSTACTPARSTAENQSPRGRTAFSSAAGAGIGSTSASILPRRATGRTGRVRLAGRPARTPRR